MSRPDAPTPRTDAAWDEEWRMKAADPNSDPAHGMCDFAMQLERELALAQAEIKGHMRIKDELKEDLVDARKYWALYFDRCIEADTRLTDAQARIAELEKDAARWRGLKGLAGHLQDGSQTTVLLDQDDATRTAFIKVGQKYYAVDGCGFNAALDAALKDHA